MSEIERSSPEELGFIGVTKGDVILRRENIIPRDMIANSYIGKHVFIEELSAERANGRIISLRGNKAQWRGSISIHESQLLPQYFAKMSEEEVPAPILALIEAGREAKKK